MDVMQTLELVHGKSGLSVPSPEGIETRLCDFEAGEDQMWDDYVRSIPNGQYCLLSGWKRIIENTYGHRGLYLWALEGETVRGVLPLIFMNSVVFGRSLVSLPFLDLGGIQADDERTAHTLMKAYQELSSMVGAKVIELRHGASSMIDLPVYGSKVMMMLPLQSDSQAMWTGFDGKLRNQIRKAMKSGLNIQWSGVEGFQKFYSVFAPNMKDLGSPVHSQKFFLEIFKAFPEDTRLLLVEKDNQTIGGAFCVKFQDTFSIPWASSLGTFRSLCPNNLLYWEAIRWSCEHGYQWFDFGRSTRGAGTYKFKKQWGAQESILHWQSVGKDANASLVQNDNTKFQWVMDMWKRLPLPLANFIGPLLRGQLSN